MKHSPDSSIIHYNFPAREGMPPVELIWYDGGLQPLRPEEMAPEEKVAGNGVIFEGTQGKIVVWQFQ